MATAAQIYQTLVAALAAQTSGFGYTVQVAEGWPSEAELNPVAAGQQVAVSAVDYDWAGNATKWINEVVSRTVYPIGITSVANNSAIPGSGTATITLGGTVNLNDAVSCVIGYSTLLIGLTNVVNATNDAAITTAIAGDTLTTLAAKLATAINAKAPLNTWISATSTGAVVTITNRLSNKTLKLTTNIGQQSDIQRQKRRLARKCQITTWANSTTRRDQVGDAISTQLSIWHTGDGFQNGDGTWTGVKVTGEKNNYADVLKNLYRRDFRVELSHSVTILDHEYSILAGIQSQSFY